MIKRVFQFLVRKLSHPLVPVIAVVLFLIGIPLIRGQALIWGVSSVQFIPWYEAAFQQIIAGRLPLWNDLNGLGAPLLANYQLAFFYPPTWIIYLFRALGGTAWMAWSVYLLIGLHIIWSGYGMVCLTRRLGLGILGQTVSALAFACSTYWIGRENFAAMIYAGSWIPWVLWGITSSFGSPIRNDATKKKPGWLLAVFIALQLFAGHAQLTFYTLVLGGLWVICAGWVNGGWFAVLRNVCRYAGFILLAVFVSGIQLIPTYEYLQASQRAEAVDAAAALSYSFWPWRFITWIAPNFFGNPGYGNYWGYANFWEDAVYIGLWPFLFVLFSIKDAFSRKDKQNSWTSMARFLWAIIAASCILALGRNTPIFIFLYEHIPTFDMFNAPTRWMMWAVFGLAILGGKGVENWSNCNAKQANLLKKITVGGAAILIGALAGKFILPAVELTFISALMLSGVIVLIGGIAFLVIWREKDSMRGRVAVFGFMSLLICDLTLAGSGLNPTISMQYYSQSQTGNPEKSSAERTYISKSDEYQIKFERFFRFSDLRALEDWEALRAIELANINILDGISMVNNFDPFVPERYAAWMDAMDQLDDETKTAWLAAVNVSTWEKRDIKSKNGITSVVIDQPAGQVQWYGCAKTPRDAADAMRLTINSLKIDPENRPVILEGLEYAADNCQEDSKASYELLEQTNDRIVLRVNAKKDGWLVLADTNFPGWKATIDNELVRIYSANYLLRGIRVAAGAHEIVFYYQPDSLIIGAGMTFVGIIVMVGWLFLAARQGLRKRDQV